MDELENKIVEFRCHKCGYYYKAMAKLCVLERQKISDEFEILIFGRDCPNCKCFNREPDPDVKKRLMLILDRELEGEIDDHRKIRRDTT